MLFHRYGTFTGGIKLSEAKHATIDQPIQPADQCTRLLVPLTLAPDQCAEPIVQIGQAVAAGQKIASAAGGPGDEGGLDVFAPLDGKVASISALATVVSPNGVMKVPAIELTNLSPGGFIVSRDPPAGWSLPSGAVIHQAIEAGALPTFREPIEPLVRWIDRARENHCDVLIANVMEGEPYVTSNHRLLAEHGGDVIRGLALLGKAIGARTTILAVAGKRTDHYRGLVGAAQAFNVSRIALSDKYPTGADVMLTKVLVRRTVAPGEGTMGVGVAVIDAATCFAVYRCLALGLLPTHRVVTVAGQHVRRPGNYWAPIGAICADLAGTDQSLVHGGPMTGLRCPSNAVVTAATDAVLAIDEPKADPPTPCIRCGWCTDLCPARLNVAALNDDFELSRVYHARKTGAVACVECGICSYVCPARLPLTHRVRQLKNAIRQAETQAGSQPEKLSK